MLVESGWPCRRTGRGLLTMVDCRCRDPLQMLVMVDSLSRDDLTDDETEAASSAGIMVKPLKPVEPANGSTKRSLVSVLARPSGNCKETGSMTTGVNENKSIVRSYAQLPARDLSSVSLLTGKRSIRC